MSKFNDHRALRVSPRCFMKSSSLWSQRALSDALSAAVLRPKEWLKRCPEGPVAPHRSRSDGLLDAQRGGPPDECQVGYSGFF